MARGPRKQSRTGIYHIMMRGVNRQSIFEEEEDRRRFLETLKKYQVENKYQVYAYCLMDNHVHLLLKEAEENLSQAVKRISSSYVYWYNLKYERVGHLFQGRFNSEAVNNTRYFLTVLRYIHQNPIKAGLVKDVFKCKWTSVHEYIGKPSIVDIDYGLSLFSPDRKMAINSYIHFMHQQNQDQCLDDTVKIRMKDDHLREYLREIGIESANVIQQMDKEARNRILVKLISLEGVSVRQLSRITGISRSVIQRLAGHAGHGDRFLGSNNKQS